MDLVQIPEEISVEKMDNSKEIDDELSNESNLNNTVTCKSNIT